MKKLSKLHLRNAKAMSDQEMKQIIGGGAPGVPGGNGTCGVYLPGGNTNFSGYFSADSYSHSPEYDVIRGISYSDAMRFISGQAGSKWCCDSCSKASWY